MSTALKVVGVTLALFLMMGTASIAQDDQPATHGGPIVGDDTPISPPATHGGGPIVGGDKPLGHPEGPGPDERPEPPRGGNGDTGGNGSPNQTPTEPNPDIGAVDTTPTGDATCFYFQDWEMDGEVLDGAYLTNSGDTVIKGGSIVYFTFPGGQTVQMTVPFDVLPGGTWAYFVGNYSFQPLVFPTGTNLPGGGDCDMAIAFA